MHRKAIVISVEGLAAASLQPYGCSWQQTRSLSELAADALVFDRFLADSICSRSVLQSLWTGQHNVNHKLAMANPPTMRAGWNLITDDEEIASVHGADTFADQDVVPFEIPETPHEEIEQTALSNLFVPAFDSIDQGDGDLTWLHITSLAKCWDVPRELCGDDEDIELPDSPSVPTLQIDNEDDPDKLIALMNVYGGQVRLLDVLIGMLSDAVNNLAADQSTLLVILGTSGFPLGENGFLGHELGPLTSTRIQLPLMICETGATPIRISRICQPHQLLSTIQAWLDGTEAGLLRHRDPASWARPTMESDWALTIGDAPEQFAFSVPYWMLCEQPQATNLFRKPDDRFDINDIARRVPEICDQMLTQASLARESLENPEFSFALNEEILTGDW